jgi:crotonobetainyl-CoA:carnitine CoA-transferase CaiB-like acyl-CoA transferase
VSLVQSILSTRPRDEWVALMNKIGVPCAPINSLTEMLAHPHTAARGIIMDYQHPDLGALKTIAQPIVFNGESRAVKSPPPRHGQHTREILHSLGYGDDRIDALQNAGAIIATR